MIVKSYSTFEEVSTGDDRSEIKGYHLMVEGIIRGEKTKTLRVQMDTDFETDTEIDDMEEIMNAQLAEEMTNLERKGYAINEIALYLYE